jgi:hypothetical protein
MLFHRQEPPGSLVSQGNFSQRRQQQQVKWGKPWIWGLLVLLVGLSGCTSISVGKTQASSSSQTGTFPVGAQQDLSITDASSSPQTQTTTRTFPVGAHPDLSITDTDAGFMHVHTGSSNAVVITATIESTTNTLPTVNYTTPDSNHIIVTVTDNSPTPNQNKVNFDVTVPASIDLDLSASAGDISIVDGIQGVVNLQSDAGNISLSNTTLIGSGSIKVSAGTITFTGSIAQGADYQFQGSAGSLDVTLPSNTNCHVDASTTTGSIQSDFPEVHIQDIGVTGQEGQGDIGSSNPSATISLETSTGPVMIHKGAAA